MNHLVKYAKEVSEKAYCPYSNFKVGVAINTDNGIFTGCNVENASFGLTICAERNAIFHAISCGAKVIKSLVIYTPTKEATAPCGACRQVIREFASDKLKILLVSKKQRIEATLDELLPLSFGPKNLI